MNFIGEIAGLAASLFFAMTAIIFTRTGRMVGSQVTKRMRLLFALTYLVILNLILFGEPLPFSAETPRWIWLGLSGVIGLALGDAFLFQSYVSIGPRLGSLLLSLAPIFGSIIAWIFFGETLTALQIVGIFLALAGIGWVVMSHQEPPDTPHGHTRRGVIFGVFAGLGQALGLVLSKHRTRNIGVQRRREPARVGVQIDAGGIAAVMLADLIRQVVVAIDQGNSTEDSFRDLSVGVGLSRERTGEHQEERGNAERSARHAWGGPARRSAMGMPRRASNRRRP